MASVKITEQEKMAIIREEHIRRIRYAIEDEVKECEENEWIDFNLYPNCEYEEQTSAEEAKEAFIKMCVDEISYLEEMNDYYYNCRTNDCYISDTVSDMAKDYGYWIG